MANMHDDLLTLAKKNWMQEMRYTNAPFLGQLLLRRYSGIAADRKLFSKPASSQIPV